MTDNKDSNVRQLYKENGSSKIYPYVIKESVTDGEGNYGTAAFGTWFRETEMGVKTLAVCADSGFWGTGSKDSLPQVTVNDSGVYVNMPLTVGQKSGKTYSVKSLTVNAETVSMDASSFTVTGKTNITGNVTMGDGELTVRGASRIYSLSLGTDTLICLGIKNTWSIDSNGMQYNLKNALFTTTANFTQPGLVSDGNNIVSLDQNRKITNLYLNSPVNDVHGNVTMYDASITNKLTVKDASITGESTFNNIVTMKTGLTVYAETDNTAINISTTGNGPHINITGANDSTGEMNVKNMGINLFGSGVAIYSDDRNVYYTPASITKNGYGKFNTLHIGPMDPENMYSSHLLNDSNWNSDNILKQPSDGSIVFSTTRFGFPGILSEENHIVAIDNNNKINVLRLNYPTSKTHSSVLMYDASVDNNLTSKLLKVNSNLVLQNNASTGHSQIKAENGLDIYAPNSGIIDIICNTNGRVAIKQGNNTGNDTDVMVVDSSKLYYGITPIPSNASGLKIKASSGIIDSDSSIILRASAEFTVSTKDGTGIYSNRLIINSSYSIFNTEVKANVNGVSDVYLGVPIYFITDWCTDPVPAHWKRLKAIGKIRYMGKYIYDSERGSETWYGVYNLNKTSQGYTIIYIENKKNNVTLSGTAYGYNEPFIIEGGMAIAGDTVTHYFALYDSLDNLVNDTIAYCSIANIYTIIAGFCSNVNNMTPYPLLYTENNNRYIDLGNLSKLSTYNGPSKIENTSIKIMKVE